MQGPGLRYTGGDELRRAAAALSAPSFKVLDVEVGQGAQSLHLMSSLAKPPCL